MSRIAFVTWNGGGNLGAETGPIGHGGGGGRHETNSRPSRTSDDLVFCERARQDSNPRPAA
jgi:hypothetical protein